ncbi:MAG TPA: hypothetical protein PK339_12400 [Flavitalea sp.]|nr:hypothetical protein [Flavitalea sp.]
METLIELLNSLGIEWAVVLIYICAGLLVKAFLPNTINIPFTRVNITVPWRVLILGTFLVAVYVFIEYQYPTEFTRATLKRLFVSYIFTTSFYEIVLKDTIAKWIVDAIKSKKDA